MSATAYTPEREVAVGFAGVRAKRQPSGVNINRFERMASSLLGGMLVSRVVRRPSPVSAVMAFAGAGLLYRGIRGHSHLYGALGINTADQRDDAVTRTTEIRRSITVCDTADSLYEFWRQPEKLAQITEDLAEITPIGDGRMRWRGAGRMRDRLHWDLRLAEDRPGESVRWESTEDGELANLAIRFRQAPDDFGTEATLVMRASMPGGTGGAIALGLGAATALRRMKALVEAGEIPTTERAPSTRLHTTAAGTASNGGWQ